MTLIPSKKGNLKNRYKNQRGTSQAAVIPNKLQTPRQRFNITRWRSIGIKPLNPYDFWQPSDKPSPITVENAQPAHHARIIGSAPEKQLDGFIPHYAIGLGKKWKNADRLSAAVAAAKPPDKDGNHTIRQSAQSSLVISKRRERAAFSTVGAFSRGADAPMKSLGNILFSVNGQCSNQLHSQS